MASRETIIVNSPRIVLDAENDPDREPDDVDIHELHRAGEARDGVGYPVLEVAGAFLCVLDQCRVDGVRQLGWDDGPLQRM
jgi:hypothetical protein